jgi:CHAD domain-containing protein
MDRRLAELSLHAFAADRLTFQLGRVGEEWGKCARSADASSIHDLRVALRRFSEALRLFKNRFPKAARNHVRSEIRQIMNLAGNTRDIDITRESFALADATLTPELTLFLENERAIAEAALRAALAVGLSTDFGRRWTETLALGGPDTAVPVDPTPESAWQFNQLTPPNARRILPGLLAEYCRFGEKFSSNRFKPEQLHDLRLSGKHLRYGLEMFRPIYGRRMDDLLAALRQTQTHLGDISDATTTLRWLEERKLHKSSEAQHLRHYLEHRAGRSSDRFLSYWRDHWGLPMFRDGWIHYLARYAGRIPPSPAVADPLQP